MESIMVQRAAVIFLSGIMIFLVGAPCVQAEAISFNISINPADVIIDTVDVGGFQYVKVDFAPDVRRTHHLNMYVGDDSIGLPELPCKNIRYAIPFGHKVTGITDIYYEVGTTIECDDGMYVLASQKNQPTLDGHDFPPYQQVDENVYLELEDFPGDSNMVQLVSGAGVLENISVADLQVTPFKYTPYNGELKVLSWIGFTVHTEPAANSAGVYSTVWPPYIEYPERAFKERFVENAEQIEQFAAPMNYGTMSPGSPWLYYLIVIPDSTYMSAAKRLSYWRTDTHRPARIFTLDEIENRYDDCDLLEKIRRTFREYHHGHGAKHLLLVDRENIRYLYSNNTIINPDIVSQHIGNCLYLGEFTRSYEDWDLDGDGVFGEPSHDNPDLYTEGYVGVVPAVSPEEFEIYVDKLIKYESEGAGCNYEYYTTCIDQMRDPPYYQHLYYPEFIPGYIQVDNSSGIELPTGFDPNPTAPYGLEIEYYYRFNQPAYVNESSHGSPQHNTGWTTMYNASPKYYMSSIEYGGMHGSITNLLNTGCFMNMWTISCYVGCYDAREWYYLGDVRSMGEGYLFVPDGGCIIYNGHSRAGSVNGSRYMTRAYWDHIFNIDGDNIAGMAFRNTRLDYVNRRYENYTMTMMGDPSISVYTSQPYEFAVIGDSVVNPKKTVVFDHVVYDPCNIPAENALVTIRQGDRYSLGYVNANGNIVNQYGELISWRLYSTDEIYLTVSAWNRNDHNILVHQDTITVFQEANGLSFSELSKSGEFDLSLPVEYSLNQNYPNPFNTSTTIQLGLPESCGDVRIDIFNLMGQKVSTINAGSLDAGYHTFTWNGFDNRGNETPSGVYFYRVTAGEFNETKRMMLVK
ncbi:MAG: T9SS type A sorting domain-containing protein [candidate division Zixibacteria bacterium]|nr:T9SS type A sorting domain-containing protein [candidate division Zixibacteria bacterium]